MTTLLATPDSITGSVDISITKTATVTKVVRSNINGVEEVRASVGQIPSVGAGSLILTDYEASHGLNTYNVYMGPEILRTNLATNPRSIGGGYSPNDGTTNSVGVTGIGTATPSGVSSATKGMKVSGTGAMIGSWFGVDAQNGSVTVRSIGAWFRASAAGYQAHFSGTGVIMTPVVLTANVWTWVTMSGYTGYVGAYVTRTDSASANLTDFCYLTGVTCIAGSEAPTGHFDGSTAASGDLTYAWVGAANNSASTEVLSNGMVTGTVTLELDKPWLSVPVMPQYSEQVDSITAFGASRESNTTVHRPLGRADSLVVMGKLGDRTGSLEVFCNSYAEARKLERIFERGEVVQLRQRIEGMDTYFTVTSIPVSPYSVQGEDATRWAMVLNYVEVRRPIGNLAGALGWTFDELASSAVSFDVITQAYATFDALTLGDANV